MRERAEARALAARQEADAEYGARVASFPRDPFGARLHASLQELQHPARKTARPPAKRPPREPLLERSEVKVRMRRGAVRYVQSCNPNLQVPIECAHAVKLDGRVDRMFLPVGRVFRHPRTPTIR